ncbi:ATP-binding protein [Actinoplanes sp. NPDC049599]|uniref:ATP-binding protein n=1 Tax=Actinoplanes sp. NPDC049599 TaxID=3363903 RepID=UPI00378DF001
MAAPDSPPTQNPGAGVAATPAPAAVEVFTRGFTAAEITEMRHDLRRHAERTGLRGDALDDFVMAVNELVTNAVRHGGGWGSLRLTLNADTLIADVSDRGAGFAGRLPVTAGPPAADVPGGRGILLARRLTDTLLISDGPEGVTVTVTRCLSAPASAPTQQ